MIDVMLDLTSQLELEIPPHGFVRLTDVMPRLCPPGHTADSAIVQAARVSYGAGVKRKLEDRALIRYLMQHEHWTPFEMVETKWHMKLPLFVARQIVRHRTASINELSGRYSKMEDCFWRPSSIRLQSKSDKQGSIAEDDKDLLDRTNDYLEIQECGHDVYTDLLDDGLAREIARAGLPMSIYTEWYWKIDLRNLMNFLKLRLDTHTQEETREYARAIHDIILPICPMAMEAFYDYVMNAIKFSGPELRAINGDEAWDEFLSKREQEELRPKLEKIYRIEADGGKQND